MTVKVWCGLVAVSVAFLPSVVWAVGGLSVSSSRIIIDGGRTSSSIVLSNASSIPYLTRVLIEDESGNKEEQLIAVPPVAYSPPGRQIRFQVVVLAPEKLPVDRESVFYFHSHSVPGNQNSNNALNVALDNRLKVFYRPSGIEGNMVAAIEGLRWTLKGGVLQATNPSKFNVSLIGVGIDQSYKQLDHCVIAPEQSVRFRLKKQYPNKVTVRWAAMDDYGSPMQLSTNIANE